MNTYLKPIYRTQNAAIISEIYEDLKALVERCTKVSQTLRKVTITNYGELAFREKSMGHIHLCLNELLELRELFSFDESNNSRSID